MGQSSKSSETPAHPSWISRFCDDQSRGGWREVLGESEETNIWSPVGKTWRDGWMDGWGGQIYWGMGDKGMWQGQRGAVVDSSASHSDRLTVRGANNSSIHSERDKHWGDFSLSLAAQITVMVPGFKPSRHWQCLSVKSLQPYGPIQSLVFLCPLCTQIIQAWSKSVSRLRLTSQTNFKRPEVDSTGCALEESILDQPADSLRWISCHYTQITFQDATVQATIVTYG